jgi:FixJ family two-component response regulator
MILQTRPTGPTSKQPLRLASVLPRQEAILSTHSVIAVIDDDASVRAALNNLLLSRAYIVHTFASAEEFLHSAHVNETSCVIADVQMSGMSGLDLLTDMRKRGHDAPFIFITAFPDDSVRDRAEQAGATCFLAKPFPVSRLIACLGAALDLHHNAGS